MAVCNWEQHLQGSRDIVTRKVEGYRWPPEALWNVIRLFPRERERCAPMNVVVLLIILLLLFGGGGFYMGGPLVGGSLGGLILLVLIVMLVTGRLGGRG